MSRKRYVICGDFNCPGPQAGQINDTLEEIISRFSQKQLVSKPTHEAGNLLDLLIVPENNINDVKNVSIHSLCFSVHSLVRCQLAFEGQQPAEGLNYGYKQINISFFALKFCHQHSAHRQGLYYIY